MKTIAPPLKIELWTLDNEGVSMYKLTSISWIEAGKRVIHYFPPKSSTIVCFLKLLHWSLWAQIDVMVNLHTYQLQCMGNHLGAWWVIPLGVRVSVFRDDVLKEEALFFLRSGTTQALGAQVK